MKEIKNKLKYLLFIVLSIVQIKMFTGLSKLIKRFEEEKINNKNNRENNKVEAIIYTEVNQSFFKEKEINLQEKEIKQKIEFENIDLKKEIIANNPDNEKKENRKDRTQKIENFLEEIKYLREKAEAMDRVFDQYFFKEKERKKRMELENIDFQKVIEANDQENNK